MPSSIFRRIAFTDRPVALSASGRRTLSARATISMLLTPAFIILSRQGGWWSCTGRWCCRSCTAFLRALIGQQVHKPGVSIMAIRDAFAVPLVRGELVYALDLPLHGNIHVNVPANFASMVSCNQYGVIGIVGPHDGCRLCFRCTLSRCMRVQVFVRVVAALFAAEWIARLFCYIKRHAIFQACEPGQINT